MDTRINPVSATLSHLISQTLPPQQRGKGVACEGWVWLAREGCGLRGMGVACETITVLGSLVALCVLDNVRVCINIPVTSMPCD